MSQAATTNDQAAATFTSMSFDAAPDTWRRNLQAGAEAARAFHVENTQFAERLVQLNLQAARAFGAPAAAGGQVASPFELAASTVGLYFDYLGRSTALARHALILPWTKEARA